jgi:hypothetical protein
MEKEVTKKMVELIGWPDGDAIFSPGFLRIELHLFNIYI